MVAVLLQNLTIALLLGWLQAPTMDVLKDNRYVNIEVTVSPQAIKSGESGEIRILFSPAEGIHLNTTPAIEFKLDSSGAFVLRGQPIQQLDAVTGFLSTSAPVRQLFGTASRTSTGLQTLTGTVVYYYCSDAEGWCMRFRQRVELPIMITE